MFHRGAFLIALAFLAFAAPARAQEQAPLLHAMFVDHAVLQRDQPIRVYGAAAPRAQVVVTLGGNRVSARADRAGRWTATLPRMSAGGPYELVASARGATQTVSDVMVGDVWLCSGQSNMEWSVRASLYAQFEIAGSANPNIRHMNIEHRAAPAPLDAFPDPKPWEVAGPDTVGAWSAACYFYARELQRTVPALANVPMGLVHSSWGGSNIRAWMSIPALRRVGGFEDQLRLVDLKATDEAAAIAEWGQSWQAWWAEAAPQEGQPWTPEAGAAWASAGAGDHEWIAAERARHVGLLWHRATFTLTAEQAAQGATLALGVMDEADHTWLNGAMVGATGDWVTDRRYTAAPGALRAGENVVVVATLNTSGQGGMRGPAQALGVDLANGERVALSDWRYHDSPPVAAPPRAPWEALNGFATLSNAMIAPIGPYNFRGVLWYQGESNTGTAGNYQALLREWMADWRERYGAGLSFLIVQLPNFGAIPREPVESGWSEVREAQRLAVAADNNAGLAVTIDVGEAWELHPPNKQEVGRRLARAGRHVVYGEAIAPSGPAVVSARRAGAEIVVTFADVQERLVSYSGAPNAFELCGPATGSCRFVTARIDGSSVHLPATAEATRVRYCWGDAPICTLSDMSGLPAGPFELAVQ